MVIIWERSLTRPVKCTVQFEYLENLTVTKKRKNILRLADSEDLFKRNFETVPGQTLHINMMIQFGLYNYPIVTSLMIAMDVFSR